MQKALLVILLLVLPLQGLAAEVNAILCAFDDAPAGLVAPEGANTDNAAGLSDDDSSSANSHAQSCGERTSSWASAQSANLNHLHLVNVHTLFRDVARVLFVPEQPLHPPSRS